MIKCAHNTQANMTLYFTLDQRNRPHLLHCERLTLNEGLPNALLEDQTHALSFEVCHIFRKHLNHTEGRHDGPEIY